MANSVSLGKIIEEFSLEIIYTPKDPKDILVTVADYNRPGLELTGYLDYFDKNRLIIIGLKEYYYFERMTSEQRTESLDRFLSLVPPAMIFCRGLLPLTK